MVKRKLTVGGLIGHLASVSHFHNKILDKSIISLIFPTCSFFNWNMIPGSLLPLFNICQILSPKT